MKIKVSVILPVHNVGRYIERCIESLRAQTLADLEFIFVDDCSTDESMAVVEAWAAYDDRVRILKNEQNLGAGPSRNRGIEVARGDYLSFIDPDDYVSPYFLDLLYATATADGGHEIAKGMRVEIDANGQKSEEHGRRINGSIGARFSRKPLYLRFSGDHWTAIYKRSLFEDGSIRYGTSRKSEDTTFTLRVCYKTEDIVIEPYAEYYYLNQRQGSAVNQRDVQRFRYELDGFEEKVAFFKKRGFDKNAYRYLVEKIHLYLSHLFMGLQGNSLTASELVVLGDDLRQAVESVPDPRLLQNDCSYRALVEHYELLPGVIYLPLDHKLAGVSQWIAFVSRHPDAGYGYLDGCAGAMAQFIEQLAGERGFRWACTRMLELAQELSSHQRCAIWFMFNHRLVSMRNTRRAMTKAKQKTCAVVHKVKLKRTIKG